MPSGFALAGSNSKLACYANDVYLPDASCTYVSNTGVSIVFTILYAFPTTSVTNITISTLYADIYNGLGKLNIKNN